MDLVSEFPNEEKVAVLHMEQYTVKTCNIKKNMSVTCATFWYFCAVLVLESAKEKLATSSSIKT